MTRHRSTASLTPLHHGRQLNAIESLRGVAALLVVFYHLVALMRVAAPPQLGFIASHFGLGVPLFYTLSGFVLAYGYADRLNSRGMLLAFYARRYFRIAPLFYTMLVLWLLTNRIVWHRTFGASTLALNLSFLFGLVPGRQESIVWAGWSVGIEMLFYLLFPWLMLGLRRFGPTLLALALACLLSAWVQSAFAAAGLGGYAYMNLLTHLPFFLAGIAAYRAWQVLQLTERPGLGAICALLAALLGAVLYSDRGYGMIDAALGQHAGMLAWSAVFALLILATGLRRWPLLERGPLCALGRRSFSLYLVHPLLMVLLIKLGLPAAVRPMGAWVGFATAAAVTLALLITVASVSFRAVELPGIALGRHVARRAAAL
ncbi:acyltransferase family protein [mine drainage metagenome]|uniref:Acyltransferase family protein n=1 Tax=mine drainage metagenome TaxID=410659 RepID=A0A1J5SHK3_9ZZZZ